jgi:hypothetical protein
MLFGDDGKRLVQGSALLRSQGGCQQLVVRTGQLRKSRRQFVALGGEVQGVQAPVSGIATSLDVATFLKVVEECHHAAWQYAEVVTERLLALAGLCGDGSQDAGLRGR